MKLIKICLIVIALVFFFINTKAQTYITRAEVISSGGGESLGGNYSNFGVIGETFVANSVTSGVYSTTIGFINSVTNTEETPPNSVNIFNNQTVKIYPNPTNGTLIFKSGIELNYIEIYDMLGSLIYKSKFKPEINISNLNEGIYLLKLYSKEGEILKTEKIIVNK